MAGCSSGRANISQNRLFYSVVNLCVAWFQFEFSGLLKDLCVHDALYLEHQEFCDLHPYAYQYCSWVGTFSTVCQIALAGLSPVKEGSRQSRQLRRVRASLKQKGYILGKIVDGRS